MGLFVDLHVELMGLLALIKTDVEAGGDVLRVIDDPPNKLPEMPCVFLLTPTEGFGRLDTMTGEQTVTTIIRLCVAQTQPQLTLLALADRICERADTWVWDAPPVPVDRGRRTAMNPVTPIFNDIPVRGADFPVEVQMTRPITPAP